MTDTRPAPNFTRNYPLDGERTGPAWRTAWELLLLRGDTFTPSAEIAEAMTADGGIVEKTALNLLRAARRHGLLDVERHSVPGRHHQATSYRIAAGAR